MQNTNKFNIESLQLSEWIQKLADLLGVNQSDESRQNRDDAPVPVEVVHETKYPFY
ncbi:MAG: hypothetical protein R3283_06700 [Balneolaceae bacterium]|nr:hypothetical protein [Balneolaceae bacterium]